MICDFTYYKEIGFHCDSIYIKIEKKENFVIYEMVQITFFPRHRVQKPYKNRLEAILEIIRKHFDEGRKEIC